MKVAVIGTGAIGGPIAAHMAENNVDVTAVTKYPELSELIQNKGIKLQGLESERYIPMKAVSSINQLDGKFDIVFLAIKAMDVPDATKSLLPKLNKDSVVVTLQNGIVEDDVAKIVGIDRVIGAVVIWAATMVTPGVIERTADGFFYIGSIEDGVNRQRMNEVAKLLEYCQPVTITDDIYGALFTKLGINAAINGLGAISGLTIGELANDAKIRLLFMGINAELMKIANELKIQPARINSFHPQDISLTESDPPDIMEKKHKIIERIFGPHKKVKASTLQSLERDQPSEIDYLNGYITKKGKELGISTPINSEIIQMVKEIEKGERKMTPDNLLKLHHLLL